jgi:hypothetical protein
MHSSRDEKEQEIHAIKHLAGHPACWYKTKKVAFTLTSGCADMNVIFLIQPDGGAANVTPSHQGGLLWARCEGWSIHHPIPPDHPWLLEGFALLTALSLQFTMLSWLSLLHKQHD